MTAYDILLASCVIGVGSAIHASLGFGIALVAAPLLVLVDPVMVPGPLILAALPLSLLIGWRERRHLELRALGWPVVGQLGGTLVAAAMLGVASEGTIGLVLGMVVLAAVGLSLVGLKLHANARNLLAAGTLAGFMGTTSSIPGPPLALVHQHVEPGRMRGTLAPFFVVGSSFSLAALAAVGRLGLRELEAALLLLPGMALGYALSGLGLRRIDPVAMRRGVLLLSTTAALNLIYRSLV